MSYESKKLSKQEWEELIDKSVVDEALSMSPIDLIMSAFGGHRIAIKGKYISVDKVLRAEISSRDGGNWVAFEWQGELIGNNIRLAQWIYPNMKYKDACIALTGKSPFKRDRGYAVSAPETKPRYISPVDRRRKLLKVKPLKEPLWDYSQEAVMRGRAYLRSRGISNQVIDYSERADSIRYTRNAVCFCGYSDIGNLKYIARRFYESFENENGNMVNKLDASGSQKRFPFMITPEHPEKEYTAFIVEGGVNALSAHDFCISKGINAFIMTTGGVAIREWIKTEHIAKYLSGAKKIWMVSENESQGAWMSQEEKQENTDRSRQKTIENIRETLGDNVRVMSMPIPNGCGDMNDYWIEARKRPEYKERMEHDRGHIYKDGTSQEAVENEKKSNRENAMKIKTPEI